VIIRICEDIRQIVVEKVERQVNSEKGEVAKKVNMMKRRSKKSAITY